MNMPPKPPGLPSPALIIEEQVLEENLRKMQDICDSAGVQLWPHIKTHKLIPILKKQVELGAAGATCAKLGEAEAMLESGVRRIFIAHSLVDRKHAPRLRALSEKLEQLVVAVTSDAHFTALDELLAEASLTLPVLLAVDTGLKREGVRTPEAAAAVADRIRQSSRMELLGIYTHEGHSYGATSPADAEAIAGEVHQKLLEFAGAIGGDLPLFPGCSVTAALMARKSQVRAVRPGAYVFGDLFLSEVSRTMPPSAVALKIVATVVDRPETGLALIDAGSKVFSSDRIGTNLFARCVEYPSITVTRLSEEHGFLSGEGVDDLQVGQRLHFVPAHVCTAVNLANSVHLVRGDDILATWPVNARGRTD